ncbi:MAG: glycosyltransferase family 39 protein [Anaerolineae bacterium]
MARPKREHLQPIKFRPRQWIMLLILLGFGLRVQQLDFQPLWGDEGWSFYFAAQPLPQLLFLTATDIHPPLYYILLKLWLAMAGYGPESARFFSVVVGTLLIPVMSGLARHLVSQRAGRIAAAAVTALMPLAIYYSQEVRMYGLVTLLGTLAVYFFVSLPQFLRNVGQIANLPRSGQVINLSYTTPFFINKTHTSHKVASDNWLSVIRSYWPYILTMTAALYTMYYAAFIFIFQLLYTLLGVIKHLRTTRPDTGQPRSALPLLWNKLQPFAIVGLLYLPWLIYAGLRTLAYVINKRSVEKYAPLNLWQFLSDHFATFSLGHVPAAFHAYLWVAWIFGLTALIGLFAVRYTRRTLYLYLYLLIPLLLQYLINQIFPFTPPYYERTLLIAAPAYWLLLAAGLAQLWNWRPWLAGLAAVNLLLLTTISLTGFYTVPRYPDEDYRPLLRDIAARATPDDTVLASYQWQLGFYDAYLPVPQPHFFNVPGWGEGWAGEKGQPQRRQDLSAILTFSPRLWFPAHQALGHFWEDETEATLAELGYPALLQWYNPQTKLTLAGSSPQALAQNSGANFENRLTLQASAVGAGQYEAGRGIVPIELTWRKEKSLGSEHRVSLRLADTAGRTWAIRDSLPGEAHFTDLQPGQTLTDRPGLLVAAGTPPGVYRLLLSVRRTSADHPLNVLDGQGQPQGAELLLRQVEVVDPQPPVKPETLPVQFITNANFGESARLVGYSLGQGPFTAGQALPLTLFWESLANAPGPLTTVLQLQDDNGQPIFSLERPPVRASTEWQRHTLLRDPYDLTLPPTLPPGDYRLVVALHTPEQSAVPVNGTDFLPLTQVTTVDRPHNFEPPAPQISLNVNFSDQARLVGLDLPQTSLKRGDTLPLTLYWQGLAGMERSWSVFVHVVDGQGNIKAQQDQIPGEGQFPTTGWLPQEYLVDPYHVVIPADIPSGQYWLEIGLYDANDGNRLPVVDEGGQARDNRVVLERWPISVE